MTTEGKRITKIDIAVWVLVGLVLVVTFVGWLYAVTHGAANS
jgi:uncharacterized membrane protein